MKYNHKQYRLNIQQRLRNLYWYCNLELQGIDVGKNLNVMPGSTIYQGNGKISIGNDFSSNSNFQCNADGGGIIIFGDNVSIGCNVVIRGANHDYIRGVGHIPGLIEIGDNVWLGANSVILPGVSIGKNSVVGAGAIVTKPIPDNSVAVGNAARAIKHFVRVHTDNTEENGVFNTIFR